MGMFQFIKQLTIKFQINFHLHAQTGGGDSQVMGVLASNFEKNLKAVRIHDPVLWVLHEIFFTPKR